MNRSENKMWWFVHPGRDVDTDSRDTVVAVSCIFWRSTKKLFVSMYVTGGPAKVQSVRHIADEDASNLITLTRGPSYLWRWRHGRFRVKGRESGSRWNVAQHLAPFRSVYGHADDKMADGMADPSWYNSVR